MDQHNRSSADTLSPFTWKSLPCRILYVLDRLGCWIFLKSVVLGSMVHCLWEGLQVALTPPCFLSGLEEGGVSSGFHMPDTSMELSIHEEDKCDAIIFFCNWIRFPFKDLHATLHASLGALSRGILPSFGCILVSSSLLFVLLSSCM